MLQGSSEDHRQENLNSKHLNPQKQSDLSFERTSNQFLQYLNSSKKKLKTNPVNHNAKSHQLTAKQINNYASDTKHEAFREHSQNYTWNLRRTNVNKIANKSFRKRQYSQHIEKLPLKKQDLQLFGKVSIHRLRERREFFERDAKSLESQYNYTLKKIAQKQRKRQQQLKKQEKIDQIRATTHKQQDQIQNTLQYNERLIERRKNKLKTSVINHKLQKQQILFQQRLEKINEGQAQRQFSSQLHEYLAFMKQENIRKNKEMYQREKQMYMNKQKRVMKQHRKVVLTAKNQFRDRWLDEFQHSETAKKIYEQKKGVFTSKIKSALLYYSKIST